MEQHLKGENGKLSLLLLFREQLIVLFPFENAETSSQIRQADINNSRKLARFYRLCS